MEAKFHELLNYIDESRLVMTWVDALDIAFIAAFISIALVWMQRRALRSLLFAVLPFLLIFLTAQSLKMYLTSMLFRFGFIALSIAFVVTFQEDFRRAFEALAAWRFGRQAISNPTALVDLIVGCIENFSQKKTGALFIFQGRQAIRPYVRAGISVEGRPSLPLFQSIFDRHSPGHDGGVTIINGRIEELGVHLPLSRHSEDTGRLGTRHAAALGLAEKCDALVIVVSEETGGISFAQNGRLRPVKTAADIRRTLRDHLRSLGPVRIHRSIFQIPWLRLATAAGISFSLWLGFARPTQLVQRMVEVPIVYRNLPKGWEARPPAPSHVKVTLLGPEGPVIGIDAAQLAASLDLEGVVPGEQTLVIGEQGLDLPRRVRIKGIDPSAIRVAAYQTTEHETAVRIQWTESNFRNPSSRAYTLEPKKVQLRIPSNVDAPDFLETEPVDFRVLRRNGRLKVKLKIPHELEALGVTPNTVEVLLSAP
ncbi:MAG: diadenylate cyclase [Bdellovibrionales bacterium]|nr:diadenylate cyclase [Bdellovibrionales bacterium]